MRRPTLSPRRSRRAWGMLLVVVVLATGFLVAIAVSEQSIDAYRLHKDRADRRAMRAAARSALGLVASAPERWLDAAFGASEARVGDYVARVSSAALPEKYNAPRADGIAYRLIRLEVAPAPDGSAGSALADVADGRLARRPPSTLRSTRLYAAIYQAGHPLRFLFLEERFQDLAAASASK